MDRFSYDYMQRCPVRYDPPVILEHSSPEEQDGRQAKHLLELVLDTPDQGAGRVGDLARSVKIGGHNRCTWLYTLLSPKVKVGTRSTPNLRDSLTNPFLFFRTNLILSLSELRDSGAPPT